MKIKCSYANRYKGIRKPVCGCKYCEDFYKEMEKFNGKSNRD